MGHTENTANGLLTRYFLTPGMRKTTESCTYVHTKEQQKVRCRAVFSQQYRDYARFFSFVFLWSCQLTKKPTTHWDFTIRKIYHKKKCSEGTMQRARCSPYLTNPALLPGQQGIMLFFHREKGAEEQEAVNKAERISWQSVQAKDTEVPLGQMQV